MVTARVTVTPPEERNAAVSPTLPNVPEGLTYVLTLPVSVSVTFIVYATLDSAPKKTQKYEFKALPSTTLTTSSTLLALKNQKYPVSPVSDIA